MGLLNICMDFRTAWPKMCISFGEEQMGERVIRYVIQRLPMKALEA